MTLSTTAAIAAASTPLPPRRLRSASTRLAVSGFSRGAVMVAASEIADDRGELLLQRCRVERFDDVVADAGLLRRNHVLALALRRDHDEGQVLQPVVRPHLAQELQAGHRLHVPVGDDEAVVLVPELVQRGAAVRRLVHVVKAKLLQQIPNDPQHRLVIVDDQDRHVHVNGHEIFPPREIRNRRGDAINAGRLPGHWLSRSKTREIRYRPRPPGGGSRRAGMRRRRYLGMGRLYCSASSWVTFIAFSGFISARICADFCWRMRPTTSSRTSISSRSKILAASFG